MSYINEDKRFDSGGGQRYYRLEGVLLDEREACDVLRRAGFSFDETAEYLFSLAIEQI